MSVTIFRLDNKFMADDINHIILVTEMGISRDYHYLFCNKIHVTGTMISTNEMVIYSFKFANIRKYVST
jgi:hypothetical protein